MLALAAMPAGATVLSFSNTSSGGTITTSGTGATATVTALSGIIFTTLAEAGNTYTFSGVTLNYNSTLKTLDLVANQALTGIFGNVSAGTNLETINLSAGLTASVGTGSGASFALNIPTVSSVVGNTTFLADMGLVNPTTFFNIGVSGTEVGTSLSFNDTSNSLVVSSPVASTPEPVSFLLFGSGLALAGLLRRKRFQY